MCLKIFRKLLNPVQCRHVCVAQRYGAQSLTLIQLYENLSDSYGVRKHILDPKYFDDNSLNKKLFCAYNIFYSGRSDNFLHLHCLTVLNTDSHMGGALINRRSHFVNYFVSMYWSLDASTYTARVAAQYTRPKFHKKYTTQTQTKFIFRSENEVEWISIQIQKSKRYMLRTVSKIFQVLTTVQLRIQVFRDGTPKHYYTGTDV